MRKAIAPEYSKDECEIRTRETVLRMFALFEYLVKSKLWEIPQSSRILILLLRRRRWEVAPSMGRDKIV